MRLICGVVGTVVAAALAVSAHALDLPPVPLPPVPTVPVPTLPLPTAPAPTVPTPTVPTPTVPAAPVPAAPVPAPAPAPAPAPQQPAPSTPASPATVTTAPAATAAPSQSNIIAAAPGKTTRSRHAAPRRRILGHFRLQHAGRVLVSVRELAPVCRTLGTYRLKARKGANTLHLPARIKRPGSYELIGRVHGHKLFTVRASVLRGRRVLLRATTSVCAASTAPVTFASIVSERATPQLHVKHATARSSLPPIASPTPGGNPLERAVSLKDAPASVRPLLFALLAVAILLLAIAAAPQQVLPAGRAAAVIATRRAYLAATGIALLVIVAVVTGVS